MKTIKSFPFLFFLLISLFFDFNQAFSKNINKKSNDVCWLTSNSDNVNIHNYVHSNVMKNDINNSDIINNQQSPKDLLYRAIKNLPDSNSLSNSLKTGFFRETALKNDKLISISEAVINIMKTSKDDGVGEEYVSLVKGRRMFDSKDEDSIKVKLISGPYLSVIENITNINNGLLTEKLFKDYTFEFLNSELIDGNEQFVISFTPSRKNGKATYLGKIYIDKNSSTFTKMVFNLLMDDKSIATDFILNGKINGLQFNPKELLFVANFKKQNGVSYLDYMRNETVYSCNFNIEQNPIDYDVISEIAIPIKNTYDIISVPAKMPFCDDDKTFDSKVESLGNQDSWNYYNLALPTKSFEDAIDALRNE